MDNNWLQYAPASNKLKQTYVRGFMDISGNVIIRGSGGLKITGGNVVGITKAMVGLSNADNTSDTNKPISTAQQTALDLKAPLASPTFTGTVTIPATSVTNTNTSTSTTTGALLVAGGVGIGGNVNIGNEVNIGGNTRIIGGLTVDGSLNVTGNIVRTDIQSKVYISEQVDISNSGTGPSLIVRQSGTQDIAAFYDDAAQVVTIKDGGDVSMNYNLRVGGIVSIKDTTISTSTTTGAFQVVGGVGVGGNLYVGGTTVGITQTMVGLSNVDNTSDVNKPVSTAQQTALDLKATIASPTFTGTVGGITKTMVGLGNVDNTTDANKPVSTAQQTALDLKATIASPTFTGTVTVPATYITNTTISTSTTTGALQVAGGVGIGGNLYVSGTTVGITKTMVGLGNVDDTSDINKPVSTAQQTALDLKATIASPTFTGTVTVPATSITNTTDSSSTTTGALQVAGGIGVGGNLYVGGTTVGITKSMVGLGNVDDTSDINKPVSTAQQTALDLKATIASPTFTGNVSGISKSMVGLGNVDDTSDINKPVSTAQQTALDLKATIASPTFTGTVTVPTTLITNTTVSTSTASGALQVAGGIGVGGNLYVGGITVGITKTMVGLGNVDDTSDASKPVSTAQQTALDLKATIASPTFTGNVSGISKSMVGLGNVDDTSDASKPVSTAQQTALDLKATIASPTFTGNVSGISKSMVGLGNVDDTSDINKPVSTAQQTALDLKATIASPTFTGNVSGISKSMVGLGNVDDTSDVNKPVSTAQQTALDLKATIASPTFTGNVSGISKSMVGLGNVDDTSDASKPVSTAQQTALDLKATIASPTFTGTVNTPATSITNTTNSNSTGSGALQVTGGAGIGGNLYVGGNTRIYGGLTVDGSFNIIGSIISTTVQETVRISERVDISSSGTGPGLTVRQFGTAAIAEFFDDNASVMQIKDGGDVSMNKQLFVGGITSIKNTTVSTSTASGALQVAGGVGIGGNLYVGGTTIGITKSMVGLSNVDNTADTAKPVSTAQQTELNLKANLASPTFTGTVGGINKTMVGLSNVDNTADTAKPVSTAQQTELNLKANLASPTFTGTVGGINKSMVGLSNVDNTADTAKPVSTAQQTELNLKAPLASPTFTGTVSGINKSMVGLGSVDNTADTAKPVSTAQQTELNLKANLASPTFTGTLTTPATSITNTTVSTNTTTGALIVGGGAGIGGNLNVGGNIFLNTGSSVYVNGVVLSTGGGSAGNLISTSTATSTSTTTGALQVIGGAGIGGNVYVGGNTFLGGNTYLGGIGVFSAQGISYGISVGITGSSTVATSNDGINWTSRGSTVITGGTAPVWSGSYWMVGAGSGANTIATSSDGITWVGRGNSVITACNSIEFNGSYWIAAGTVTGGNGIAKSTDGGITWVPKTTPMGTQIPVWLTWNSRIKLWAAVTYGAGGSVNNTITSTDGDTWSPTISSTYRFQRIHNNGAMFLGMDDNSKAPDYSYDGKTWFSGGAITGGPFLRNGWAAWNGSIWLTVGIGGAGNPQGSATSPDGITWTRTTGILDQGYHVMWNGSVWIAGGKYYSADNGATWTLCQGSYPTTAIGVQTSSIAMPATSTTTGALVVSGGAGIGGNTYIGGTLFANGTAPQNAYNMVLATNIGFFTSTDTVNWTLRNNTVMSGVASNVVWNGTIWLAVATSGTHTTATSPDGITWTGGGNAVIVPSLAISAAYSPTLGYWMAMTYNTSTTTPNIVYRSTNKLATSWSVVTGTTVNTTNTQNPGVVWSSQYSKFYFSNYAGVSATYDGTSWGTLTIGNSYRTQFMNVDGPFLLTGGQNHNSIQIYYSLNGGGTWTGATLTSGSWPTNSTMSMAFSGSIFVVSFDRTPWLARSADYGKTWTLSSTATNYYNTITWNGTYFVGTIGGTTYPAYSTDGITWTTGSASSSYSVNSPMGIGAALFAAPAISTSTTTGGLVVSGGAGIGGNVYVGGNINLGTNGNIYSVGGVNITSTNALFVTNNNGIKIMASMASTSTDSGALQVIGGAGIVGNVYVGGNIIMTNNSTSTRFGYLALNSGTGSNNTAFGASALNTNTTSINNTAIGASALTLNTGSGNTGVGYQSATNLSSGNNNTAIGSETVITNGVSNAVIIGYLAKANANGVVSIGYNAGINSTGGSNTAVGQEALGNFSNPKTTSGGVNTCIGTSCGRNIQGTAEGNTGVGALSLGGEVSTNTSTGGYNAAFGYVALSNLTAGARNTGIGTGALKSVTTGTSNTALGNDAGAAITTETNNICIGYLSNTAAGVSNSVAIGTSATVSTSNQIVLGTASESVRIVGTAVSSSTTTGALVVSGGAGIRGNVNVGGTLNCSKIISPFISTQLSTNFIQNTAVLTTGNWYRIAFGNVNGASWGATFVISINEPGDHQYLEFKASYQYSHDYTLTVLNNSTYDTSIPITALRFRRITQGGASSLYYDNHLEIKIGACSGSQLEAGNCRVYMTNNFGNGGLNLVNFEAPTGTTDVILEKDLANCAFSVGRGTNLNMINVTDSGVSIGGDLNTDTIRSKGSDFCLWNTGRGGTGTSDGRALVHIQSNGSVYTKANSCLYINFSSDFGAGTWVDSNLTVNGTITGNYLRASATGGECASFAGNGTNGAYLGFYLNGFGTRGGFVGFSTNGANAMSIESQVGDLSVRAASWIYLNPNATNGQVYMNAPTVYITGFLSVGSFTNRSDYRIKKDIIDISGQSSLESLRRLKPKEYTVINHHTKTNTYGFIAQEVKEIIPKAVSITSDFIPSIYEMAFIDNNKTTITLINKTTESSWKKIKISSQPYEMAEIIDDKSFRIEKEVPQDNIELVDVSGAKLSLKDGVYRYKDTNEIYTGLVKNGVFVFGPEVDDFHNIQNDIIWTVTTSATQELDRQLQEAKQTIRDQDARILNLEEQIALIKQHLNM